MANGKGQGGPASQRPNHPRNTAIDRELGELERKKMAALREGRVVLTRDGYLEICRLFPRRRS